MNKEKVIEMKTGKAEEEALFMRRANVIKDIAKDSVIAQLQEVKTFQFAAGIGLWQGLKYRGSIKQGMKAGVAALVVVTGCNIVNNVIIHIDEIKNA